MPCKKIKRKREKDQKTVALGLDIITWISPLGYHHLDIITWISSLGYHHLDIITWISSLGYHHLDIITYEMATTISSHLPTDCLPTGILTAYSVQHQTRPDQTSANKKNKEIKKNKKKIKKTTAQSIPMWSPTIVLTLPSTV
jgi:hypothetical protein